MPANRCASLAGLRRRGRTDTCPAQPIAAILVPRLTVGRTRIRIIGLVGDLQSLDSALMFYETTHSPILLCYSTLLTPPSPAHSPMPQLLSLSIRSVFVPICNNGKVSRKPDMGHSDISDIDDDDDDIGDDGRTNITFSAAPRLP